MKTCRTCQRALPLDSFTFMGKYVQLDCKPCVAAKMRERRRTDGDTVRAYQRAYYQRKKDTELPRMREANLRAYHKMKREIVERLGDVCCACGHEDRRVLQVDHVNGGGGAERRDIGHSKSLRVIRDFLRESVKQSEYQLLCANCHALKTLGHAA